jgi:hypothetical protein
MLYVVFFFMAEQPLVGQGLLCTVLSVRLNAVGVRHLDPNKLV